jgi:DNA-binding winged helix-turn-helix (wHTH) protein
MKMTLFKEHSMLGSHRQVPLSYRSDCLEKVIPSLRAGECCSLIGPSGVGKSNLARFLYRPDVQQHYWDDEPVWIVLLDLQGLVVEEGKGDYAALELMVYRLLEEAELHNSSAKFLEEARQLHAQLTEKGTAHYAFRVLQRICKHVCTDEKRKVVFVCDQFEDIWQTLSARFFVNLRHLRDQFKYQVVFLVMTRDRLRRMRTDAQAVETFWELFSVHTYGLGPYSGKDAAFMVEQLVARTNFSLDAETCSELLRLSGHHPSLLRTIFWVLHNEQQRTVSIDELLEVTSVTEECQKIWKTFSPLEQGVLQLIAQGRPVPQLATNPVPDLRLKGIVQDHPPKLFSPLLAAYALRVPENSLMGVSIDISKRQVWLDGQLLPQTLPNLEFRFLAYLVKHAGSVCHQKDLMSELYEEETYVKNDQRLYALLARLRKALGENAHQPRYIMTHHGGGVQLLKGQIIDIDSM